MDTGKLTVIVSEQFENPAVTGVVPEGYVTGDEFEKQTKDNIDTYCKEHGIL